LTVLDLLNLAGDDGWSSGVHVKKKQLEHSFGIHTGHNMAGNVRSLVANHVTEFKNFNFWTC